MTPPADRPTDAQLEILNVLWESGPATVREVHAALERDAQRSYTTTLKTLQIMAQRGLVVRDDKQRSHVYSPAVERRSVQQSLLKELRQKAFGGSAMSLAMHALTGQEASPKEIAAIRDLLNKMEDQQKGPK